MCVKDYLGDFINFLRFVMFLSGSLLICISVVFEPCSAAKVQHKMSMVNPFQLESVLAMDMKERKSQIKIYFYPHQRVYELATWNNRFWGGVLSPDDSALFQKIPWLYWAWTDLMWEWVYDVQGFVS